MIKTNPTRMTVQKRTQAGLKLSAVTLASSLWWQGAQVQAASVLTVDLGAAADFAILAGAGITIAAPAGTLITGDIGAFPTTSITGLEYALLNGVNQQGNGVTQSAKTALMVAYMDAVGRPADFTYSSGHNLTGTLEGGVYESLGSMFINGTVTLDAGGDSSKVWIFQAASTLIAASGAQVILTNGALASNVFWQVGSSATLDTNVRFSGTILATESITMNAGVIQTGRALAMNGAVTMGSTIIAVPEPALPMFLSGALVCFGLRRRKPVAVASCGR